MKLSQRAQRVAPFYVMELAKAASEMQARARPGDAPMIALNIGEPDFTAPPLVQAAAQRAIEQGLTQYTPATGLPALREAISRWYATRWGVAVDPARIIVTAGASAALQLACLALIDEGDEVLMPDPCYPCNRQFVQAAGGQPVLLPCGPDQRFQLSTEDVTAAWGPATRGVLLASPSNPTGTSIDRNTLQGIATAVRDRGGVTILDEIYLGLSFDERFGHSALTLPDGLGEGVISVNSFSKYFNMTGWRLGWLVVPAALVEPIERLAQNLFICPSTVAQHAALACFEPESLTIYETRRAEFKARRDYFIPELQRLGLQVPVMPDGAFYAWADVSDWCERWGLPPARVNGRVNETGGSWALALALMERCALATTPGRDFGVQEPGRYLRFSTANAMGQLRTTIERLEQVR
ncbi:MAG: Aspartate aminotransferase [Pseudomonadota bacterium]|jgi:aspartate/methionine/tyrosine aminotransferase